VGSIPSTGSIFRANPKSFAPPAMPQPRSTAARACVALLLIGCAGLLSSCSQLPSRPFLRLSAVDVQGWQSPRPGVHAVTIADVSITAALDRPDTRLLLTCRNHGDAVASIAVGTESARGRSAAIGEIRIRPEDRLTAEGLPDFAPCRSLEPFGVDPAWMAEFYLDAPLGREPTVGQYFVLVVEVRRGDGVQRALLPLTAGYVSR
jgi:hypothetical protein